MKWSKATTLKTLKKVRGRATWLKTKRPHRPPPLPSRAKALRQECICSLEREPEAGCWQVVGDQDRRGMLATPHRGFWAIVGTCAFTLVEMSSRRCVWSQPRLGPV